MYIEYRPIVTHIKAWRQEDVQPTAEGPHVTTQTSFASGDVSLAGGRYNNGSEQFATEQ